MNYVIWYVVIRSFKSDMQSFKFLFLVLIEIGMDRDFGKSELRLNESIGIYVICVNKASVPMLTIGI